MCLESVRVKVRVGGHRAVIYKSASVFICLASLGSAFGSERWIVWGSAKHALTHFMFVILHGYAMCAFHGERGFANICT